MKHYDTVLRRTKIICTLGPATDNIKTMCSLLESGMDVARFNCSHGTHAEHAARLSMLRDAEQSTGKMCAVMLDTQGPEIRTGTLAGARPVPLPTGQMTTLTPRSVTGTPALIHQSYPRLAEHLVIGDRLLLDDGVIELRVENIAGSDVECRIVNGGVLGERKSVNVPGVSLGLPSMTKKDEEDLLFGISENVDLVAASFVRSAEDIEVIRNFLNAHGGRQISIIAKVECAEAIENFDEILRTSDGIMVARGDLGVEVPLSRVPHIQKKLIRSANRASKPVITATQMLDSMIRSPRPTRAEATDVANAVYDGTGAVMLSGETANGTYPIEAVKTMAELVRESESHMFDEHEPDRKRDCSRVSMAVGKAAVETAENIGAACIVAPTMSGRTSRLVSSLRPRVPVYAVTPDERVARQQMLEWGVYPIVGTMQGDMREVIRQAEKEILVRGLAEDGDIAVLTAGDPSTSPFVGAVSVGNDAEVAATNAMYVVQLRK